ncbi:MAG: guanylate kinase [Dehalococcoidia bacterium]|nr:guanylate kinase [Dehalococcoidia bacterium]
MSSGTERNNLLIILSGPSGVGKDAVLDIIKERKCPFHYVVTATTRQRRAGEQQGIDYHFLSREQFHRMKEEGELLEWAEVYGNYYGVPREEVNRALASGEDVILKTDVQGAATLKKIIPQAVFIFLMPPSIKTLERRLKRRNSDTKETLALRLEKARAEIEKLPLFDYVITNREDRLDDIIAQLQAIISAEKCRVKPRKIALETVRDRGELS